MHGATDTCGGSQTTSEGASRRRHTSKYRSSWRAWFNRRSARATLSRTTRRDKYLKKTHTAKEVLPGAESQVNPKAIAAACNGPASTWRDTPQTTDHTLSYTAAACGCASSLQLRAVERCAARACGCRRRATAAGGRRRAMVHVPGATLVTSNEPCLEMRRRRVLRGCCCCRCWGRQRSVLGPRRHYFEYFELEN